MTRATLWVLAVAAVTALLVAGTVAFAIGEGILEYNLSFVAIGVASVAAWPLLTRRRVVSIGLAVLGVAVILTGFWLLYWKEDLKASGLKDLAKFWHSVTSVAIIPFFVAHFLRNWSRFRDLSARAAEWRLATGAYAGGWLGVGVLGAASGTEAGRAFFTEENYLGWVAYTWLGVVALLYLGWLVARIGARLAPRVRALTTRHHRRGAVDLTLLASFLLATLTGFVLLYLKTPLHANGFKHVAKYWHAAPSIVFTAIVVLHVGANLRPLVGHVRRVWREMGNGAR